MMRTILFTFVGLASAIRMDGARIAVHVSDLSGQEHLIECDAGSTVQDLRVRIAAAADCSPNSIQLFTAGEDSKELTNLDGTLCENDVVDDTELHMIIDVIDEFCKSLNRSELALFRNSPWNVACRYGRVDVVEALIAQGESIGPHATLYAVDSTFFSTSSEEKSMKILRLLLDNGAEPSKHAVENAVWRKHEEALQLLLDRDPSLVKTAFDWTLRLHAPQMTEWLIEQGYEDPTILVN